MKTCNKCNQTKTLDGFSPDSRMADGYLSTCRMCRTQAIKEKKERIRELGPSKSITEKRCNKCRRVKPTEEFNRDSGCLDGFAGKCKECCAKKMANYRKDNREKYNAYMRSYRTNLTGQERYLVHIFNKYGITEYQYNKMLEDQSFSCSICDRKHDETARRGRLHVDHCHTTGKVRGLLCLRCNMMIGYALEDTRILAEAIAYVAKHKKPS